MVLQQQVGAAVASWCRSHYAGTTGKLCENKASSAQLILAMQSVYSYGGHPEKIAI
jgi:hypothetical protein